MAFGISLPGENRPKFLFLKPNLLVDGIIAKASSKKYKNNKTGLDRDYAVTLAVVVENGFLNLPSGEGYTEEVPLFLAQLSC